MSSEYNSLFWFHLSHVNSIVRIFVLRFLRFLFHLLVISEYNLHMFSLFESMIFLQLIGIIVFQFRSRFCFEFHFMIFHSSTVDSWWWQSHNFVLLLLLLHVLENHRFSSVIRCIERLIRCSIVVAALSSKMNFHGHAFGSWLSLKKDCFGVWFKSRFIDCFGV
jgi:hypothetical protein